jgi:hypothetical protein
VASLTVKHNAVASSPFVPLNMDIDDLFHSTAGRIAAFAQMQLHLYRHDISLQDYFLPLQLDTGTSPRFKSREQRASSRLISLAIRGSDAVGQLRPRRKIKTDVLFCPIPYFERKTENRFLVRTLLGLAQTDAKILCLLPDDAPCRDELDAQLAAVGRSGQVAFLDPVAPLYPAEARLRSIASRMRGHRALEETVRVLEPLGLSPSQEVQAGFEHTAYFVEAWERLAPWVEFDAVVARCHWNVLCSPVCRTARQRNKPVITFQQGVIGHTLDAPVTASKYVAFGQPSASFLARLNSRFFQAVGTPEPPVEYVNGGSLFDTLTALPDQFDRQTLLMVDAPVGQGDFYGIESQCQALLQLAEKLLAADLPIRQLVIRPHPYWSNLDLEACKRLVREYPTRCELSHPAWSLEDDLRRSSAAVGIFSGVLTVASACGLPTFFLETEQGYTTGDLACFGPCQTLLPDAAFCEIGKILANRKAYAEARTHALRNAREYYAGGTNLDLGAPFFERLLRAEPVNSRPQHDSKQECQTL